MKHTDRNGGPVTGRTSWDILFELLFNSRYALLFVCLAAGLFALSLWLGFITIDHGEVRTNLVHNFGVATNSLISGAWKGTAKDIQRIDSPVKPLHTYQIHHAKFEVTNAEVKLEASYSITSPKGETERGISGIGKVYGEYLNVTYEVRTSAVPGGLGYGVMLLHFAPSGSRADGHFLTRSMKDDGIIFGEIHFER